MSINTLLGLWCGGICLVTLAFTGVNISKSKEKFSSVSEGYKLLKNEYNKIKCEYKTTLDELNKIRKNLEELESAYEDLTLDQCKNNCVLLEYRESIINDIKIIKEEIKRISKEAKDIINSPGRRTTILAEGLSDDVIRSVQQIFARH